ncbi:MAG: hypothetical protein ACFFE2_03825 [Candidatus Thorarchaeota archaeon]
MSVNRIAEHLIDQFNRSWKMLRQAIENVPEEKWTEHVESIDVPWNETKGMNVWYFSNIVYHVIQTVEFYALDDPDDMRWGHRIGGIDWKSESPEVTSSKIKKNDMLEYMEETMTFLNDKLRSFSEDEMFEADGFSGWQDSRLMKFVYTLRHSMWHIGELGRSLRNFECNRITWH